MEIYPPIILSYFFTGVIFLIVCIIKAKRHPYAIYLGWMLPILVIPNLFYGLWSWKHYTKRDKEDAETFRFYMIRKAAWIHLVWPFAFLLIVAPVYEYVITENFFGEGVGWFGLGFLYLFVFLGIPFLLIFAALPFVISAGMKKRPAAPVTVLNKEEEEYWERREAPEDPDEVKLDNPDEYIPLKDDEEDNDFTIDL